MHNDKNTANTSIRHIQPDFFKRMLACLQTVQQENHWQTDMNVVSTCIVWLVFLFVVVTRQNNFKVLNFEVLSLKSNSAIYIVLHILFNSCQPYSAYGKWRRDWECVIPAKKFTAQSNQMGCPEMGRRFSYIYLFVFSFLVILMGWGHKHLSSIYMTSDLF